MVRTLTRTLQAAVGTPTRQPAIQIQALDTIAHFAAYQSPAATDAFSDACIANDGSIIRVYLSRGGTGYNQALFWQRITDPTNAAQWNTWTAFTGGSGNMYQDGQCAVSNNAGVLHAFAQQGTGGNAIYNWTSTNNGASWSGPGTVCSPPGGTLIAGISSAGNSDVFFQYAVVGGYTVGACFYSGGWSAINTWTLGTISEAAGIATNYGTLAPDYLIVYSDGYALHTALYNSSTSTWLAGITIVPATTTSIARVCPRLFYDTATGLMNLTCIEFDTGAYTGTVYQYPRVRQSAANDLVHWSNGWIAQDINSTTRSAILLRTTPPSGTAGNRYYLMTLSQVDSALAYTSNAQQYLDVSSAITRYTRQERSRKPSKLDLWLDNTGGAYNALVATAGHYGQPIAMNTTLILSEGYVSSLGIEVVQVNTFHITTIQFVRNPEENQLHLIAEDLTKRLDYQSRFQYTYNGQTISWLIAEMCAKAGLFIYILPTTAQMSEIVPTYILHAGQTYRQALNELCDTYGLEYFLDQAEVMQIRELSSSDASVWSYQPEIETVTFGSDDERGNHMIVSGKPPVGSGNPFLLTTGEAYDDVHMRITGEERVWHHADTKLTSDAQATLKAGFLLAAEQRAQVSHAVTVPENPALQLLDVVTLTDYNAPIGSGQGSNARIIEQIVKYIAQKAEYEQLLKVEGV